MTEQPLATNHQTPIAKSYVLFLEGYRARFSKIIVHSSVGSFLDITITVPFDHRGKVRGLMPKTLCHICFEGDDGKLYLIAEGELDDKSYSVAQGVPTGVDLHFSGVASNVESFRVATPTNLDSAAPGTDLSVANEGEVFAISGDTVSPGGSQATEQQVHRSLFTESIVAKTILENFSRGNLSLADAYAAVMSKFLAPGQTVSGSLINKGSNIGIFGSIAHYRFNLIDTIVDASSNELVNVFMAPDNAPRFYDFMEAAIGRYASGENSVHDVLRDVITQAWHQVHEPACPSPLDRDKISSKLAPTSGVDAPSGNGKSAARIGVFPRMLITPVMLSAVPPVCNVFVGPIVTGISMPITIKKPTRQFTVQSTDDESGNVHFLSILPGSVAKLITGATDGSFTRVVHANGITEEELAVGVHASTVVNPLPNASHSLDLAYIGEFIKRTKDLRFLADRTAAQQAVVNMSFNPYACVGLPGLVYDPSLGTIRGAVYDLTHVLTPSSGRTRVIMSNCEMQEDAMDNVFSKELDLKTGKLSDEPTGTSVPIPFIDTGFDKAVDFLRHPQLDEIYARSVGVMSIATWFKANSHDPNESPEIPGLKKPLYTTGDAPYVDGIARSIYKWLSQNPEEAHYLFRQMVRRPIITMDELDNFYRRGNKNKESNSVKISLIGTEADPSNSSIGVLPFPNLFIGTDEKANAGDFSIEITTDTVRVTKDVAGQMDSNFAIPDTLYNDDKTVKKEFVQKMISDAVSVGHLRMNSRTKPVLEYLQALEVNKDSNEN